MKKIKILFILLISVFVFNLNILAASGNLSVSSSNVYVGDTFTVSANISGAAAWNVHVNSSGPVSGCSINEADTTADASDTNKNFSVTCTATGEGTITITLSGDITSADDDSATSISGSRSVIVSKKPTQPSNNNSNNNNNNSTGNSNNTNESNQVVDNKSNNNNIKSLDIDGYELTKIDNNNYTLSVSYGITSVNVKATAEDSKAKISGIGNHKLNVGDNNIEIIVTSESGVENKINIKVIRKDGYYLDDLEKLLNDNKVKNINIIIDSDTKITNKDIEKIKNSKKTVSFSYYNSDKVLMYSWIINGAKIKNTNELVSSVNFDSNNKKDILKLSNYADGMYVSLNNSNKLSGDIKLKVYVGNKYSDNDKVNVYLYNNENLNLVCSNIKVNGGYIEFDVSSFNDYFITMSNINNNTLVTNDDDSIKISKITIIIILFITLILSLIFTFIYRKKVFSENNINVNIDKNMQ